MRTAPASNASPAPPLRARSASLARRAAALVYEGLLLVALLFVVNFALLPFVTPRPAGHADDLVVPALPQRLALFWIVFAALAGYFCWCWSRGRRTLPMKTWRLRLVRGDGTPLPPRTALLRYLAAWIGPLLATAAYAALAPWGLGAHATWLIALGFLWAFIDRDRQFLHDRIAGTYLVTDSATGVHREDPT
ncbi:MAG: RDD family protein [Burkholderiales bacterium]|nr:RDD family protein [Burkholderiales bacterium]